MVIHMKKRDPSVSDRFAKVEKRLGKTTGASKGTKPTPDWKIKPKLGKDSIGFKATKKF